MHAASNDYSILSKLRRIPIRSIFTRESQSGLHAFFLIVFAIVLMVMDKRYAEFATVRSALSLPVAPLQYIVHWPISWINQLKVVVNTHDNLIQENLNLKAEQLLLRSQLQRFIAIESENHYLKTLLQSSSLVKGKTLIAELLNVDLEPFVNQAVLNKGSKHGVYIGQPVVDASGVMGQVIQVGPITSRILLISDTRSGISVQNTRNGIRAVAVGESMPDKLRLAYVPKTADVRAGDIFITSGLGYRYPEGYPVGKVSTVTKNPEQQFATIYLQPSAHLNSSRQVLLIWYQT